MSDNNLQSGTTIDRPSSGATEWSIISFLGRINYSLDSKYLFTVSGRYDGSSRFGANHKFAFFPSGAFAWRLSQEDFMKDIKLISDLKLRTGVGVTGNQEFGLYQSLPTLANSSYTIGQDVLVGFSPNIIPNPDLKWERNIQYDAGADIGFLNNDVSLTLDYYYRKGSDLIFDVTAPMISGFTTSLQNIARVKNTGVEIGLTTRNINRELRWNTSFNISFNKNKVLYLGGIPFEDVGSGDADDHLKIDHIHRLMIGQPIGTFYGYVFDGVYQTQAEADNGPKGPTNYPGGKRYVDISGPDGKPDGIINANYDRRIIGDPNPEFYGGLNNTFSYKGFDLSVFMNFQYGNKLLNFNSVQLTLPSGGQNVYADLEPWTPENHSNTTGKATTNRSAIFSNQFLENGSFLKFRTVTLSYGFPNLKSNIVSNLRIYITGNNLATITKYSGYDPDVSYKGVTTLEIGEDLGGYPSARTFQFGVNLSLK